MFQKNKKSTNNFDSEFTHEKPCLTPSDMNIIKTINQGKDVPHLPYSLQNFLTTRRVRVWPADLRVYNVRFSIKELYYYYYNYLI